MAEPNKKVLVVDDEPFFCTAAERFLGKMGFTVVIARDGHEALEVYNREQPFAVTLDYLMPGLNGPGVLRELKKGSPSLPVIVISAMGQPEKIKELEDEGAYRILEKPVDLMELSRILRSLQHAHAREH